MGRRFGDDDDDDDLDISRPGAGHHGPAPTNGLAITSMILGITSLVVFVAGCGCSCFLGPFSFLPWGLALVGSVMGIILGFMGNTPGSEGFAWTGIICSFVVVLLFLVSVVLAIVFGVAFFAAAAQGPR